LEVVATPGFVVVVEGLVTPVVGLVIPVLLTLSLVGIAVVFFSSLGFPWAVVSTSAG